MIKKFFITGTDTDVGKTVTICMILKYLSNCGYKVAGYKPVSSGCYETKFGPRSSDALSIIDNSNVKLKYHNVNPFAFIELTAPHIASYNQNKIICSTKLSEGIKYFYDKVDFLLIEGSGGWLTPLTDNLSYADWVVKEKLPVILVVDIKIGCINHALLTQIAIKNTKVNLVGWIANHTKPLTNNLDDYLSFLKKKINSPLLVEIPNLNLTQNTNLFDYINFEMLKSILL